MFDFFKNKNQHRPVAVDIYHEDLLDGKERGHFIAWQFSKINFANYVPKWIRYEDFNGYNHDKIHLWSQYAGDKIEGEYDGNIIHENDFIVSDENDDILIMSPKEFASLPGTFIYGSDIIYKIN